MQRIFAKKRFLFTVGSICGLKHFTTGPLKDHLGDKRFAHDVEVETEVREWLRQLSKDLYGAGFELLEKRWDE
jgi:hypothetical protein